MNQLNDGITNLSEAKSALELQRIVLKTMAELVEFRDGDTGGHIERTQRYLGALLGALIQSEIYSEIIDQWDVWLVISSAQLHDVGKIATSDNILRKPGKLTQDEFEEIKKHPSYGAEIIEKIEKSAPKQSFLEHAKIFAYTHHEKWDASGYPRGLEGTEIPLQGRLMAIADVYDALISKRPYKKPFAHEKAVEIIKGERGKHFDPILVDIFIDISKNFEEIAISMQER